MLRVVMNRINPTNHPRIDRIGRMLLLPIVAALYLWAYRSHPSHPHIHGDKGWWSWYDQSWYLSAATAWSNLDLNPARHLYLPGYALLAAPFARLLSVQAFVVPNLLCLLVSLWLFSALAAHLLPRTLPYPRLVGGIIFAVTTLGSTPLRTVWVVPWSTTGSVPFVYAALLGAVCFIKNTRRAGLVFWVGFMGGCIAGFRPVDSIPVLSASAVGMALAVLLERADLRTIARSIVWGAAGLGCAIIATGLPYVAIYGLRKSDYVITAGMIGFEWRFLPLHWVLLGLDARPLVDDGSGLVEAFFWLPIGLVACLVRVSMASRAAERLIHLTVATASCLHIALYLCYRDLYPEGFFRYWNYHYFKWVIPVMALYAIILVHDLMRGPRRLTRATLALAGLAVLLPWRAELGRLTPMPHGKSPDPAHVLDFISGLDSIRDVILVAAAGDWNEIYEGSSSLSIDGRTYVDRVDYKLLPAPGGFLLVPLRPLRDGPARLTVGPDLHLDPTAAPLHGRQDIVLGLPCWLPAPVARCETRFLLPPAVLPPSGMIQFDGTETPFLAGGWSGHEPGGRWTDRGIAALRLRTDMPKPGPLRLRLTMSAYVPSGSAPLTVHLAINDRDVASRTFTTGGATTMAVDIPASITAASPTIDLRLLIDNPRSPAAYATGSTDGRQLGLFIRTLTLTSG